MRRLTLSGLLCVTCLMKVYLDNCCFNRPFDDQSSLVIRLETEAKLYVQELIRQGEYRLCWSFVLDYENSANPFRGSAQ